MKLSIKLKTNQVISYNDYKGIKYTAKVLSRGGKSSEKYNNAYNIEYISPNEMNVTQSWINLDNVSNLWVTTNNQMELYNPASENSTESSNTTQIKTEEV